MARLALAVTALAVWLAAGPPGLVQASDWPQWMGPTRDGRASDSVPLPSRLPAELKPLWRIPVGGGFSAPVVAGDRLVYLDAPGEMEIAHLVDATTGREMWKVEYGEAFEDEWGKGPRATPLMDDDRLYVQSCKGEFRCLNARDGKTIWRKNFETDFGAAFLGKTAPEIAAARRRGNDGSGAIDGDNIFLPAGGPNACLVCCNKKTGAVVWKSQSDEMAYSSLKVATLADIRQIVAFTAEALIGVQASDGKLLWRVPLKTNARRHAATPVIEGNRVLVNSHTFGLICLEISKTAAGCEAKQKWLNADLKINVATPVIVDRHLYSQGPAKNFICADLETGRQEWAEAGFGKEYSATLAVGKSLLILTDAGQLVLAAADPKQYRELGRLQVCGKNWNFPAYANGKLYVRDYHELLCLDLAR